MLSVGFSLHVILICAYLELTDGEVARSAVNTKVKVNKCCEPNEIYVGRYCTAVNESSEWKPLFTSESGKANLQIDYSLVMGVPNCGHKQVWPIYQTQYSTDRLHLLPNGVLRHFFDNFEIPEEEYNITGYAGNKTLYHDYEPGKYCLDKVEGGFSSGFAWVCAPDIQKDLLTTEFPMHNSSGPLSTHAIAIVSLLVAAIFFMYDFTTCLFCTVWRP